LAAGLFVSHVKVALTILRRTNHLVIKEPAICIATLDRRAKITGGRTRSPQWPVLRFTPITGALAAWRIVGGILRATNEAHRNSRYPSTISASFGKEYCWVLQGLMDVGSGVVYFPEVRTTSTRNRRVIR